MNQYDRDAKDNRDWKMASLDRIQYALEVDDYLEDISLVEPGYEWLSTDQARWLTRQDEIINFW